MIGTAERAALRPTRVRPLTLAAGALVFAALAAPPILLHIHVPRYPVDLAVYREAGRYAIHHRNPYSPGFGDALRIKLPFTYPPFAALVFAPLALIPVGPLLAAWTGLCLSLLLGIAYVGVRPAMLARGWTNPVAFAAAAGALVWALPVYQTISYGQINLILVAACLADCAVLPLRAPRWQGVLVGVATAIKLTPGIFIAYFALTRQWVAAVRAAATAAACGLLAFIVYPGPSRQYWLHLVFDTERPGSPAYYANQSLFGILDRLNATGLWVPLAALVGCLGLWRAVRAHRAGSEVTAVALVGLTAIAVSPISWQHHGVWIVLAAGALIMWATTLRRAVLAIAGCSVFFLSVDYWGERLASLRWSPWITMGMRNAYAIAFIALLALLPLSPGEPSGIPSALKADA